MWHADLDATSGVPSLDGCLAADERRRADAYVFATDRRRFVAARGLLRLLLAGYLGCGPATIAFDVGRHGKPELALDSQPAHRPPLRFNCSHSQGRALLAFTTGRRVGVDIEVIRPVPEALDLAVRWLAAPAQATLAAIPAGQRDRVFLRCWTSREAHAKAVGIGLTDQLPPGAAWRQSPAPWSSRHLSPTKDSVGTIVAEGTGLELSCWAAWVEEG